MDKLRFLGALSSRLPRVLGTSSRLRKVRIRIFQHGVLIPVSELLLKPNIAFTLAVIGFLGALGCILIRCVMYHESPSHMNSRGSAGDWR